MSVLPMFPLGVVLFPGAVLPLHVFEPRYRELVRVCMEGTPEFGVTLIERGQEVGGGDARFDVGCVARIVEAAPFDDGRWALIAVGVRRIRVDEWLPDDPYPRAEVHDWDEGPAGPGAAAAVARVVPLFRRVLALAAEAGEATAPATVDLDDDPAVASHQMAALAPIGPLDKLALLASPSPDERLVLLEGLLSEEAAVLAHRLHGG